MEYQLRYGEFKYVDFEEIQGQTFNYVVRGESGYYSEDDALFFVGSEYSYILVHEQTCCERVYIESIEGDIFNHLPNETILLAECRTNKVPNLSGYESATWTFFTIRTMRDTFTIRFYGSSNGYYGETAECFKVKTSEHILDQIK